MIFDEHFEDLDNNYDIIDEHCGDDDGVDDDVDDMSLHITEVIISNILECMSVIALVSILATRWRHLPINCPPKNLHPLFGGGGWWSKRLPRRLGTSLY